VAHPIAFYFEGCPVLRRVPVQEWTTNKGQPLKNSQAGWPTLPRSH